MRVIAEYIVRGRSQAIIVALIGTWLPLVTQATLSLVTLRKGASEGLLVLMWTLLPSLAAFWLGNASLVLVIWSMVALAISFASATMLRFTMSWPATLAGCVAITSLSVILAVTLSGEVVAEMQQFAQEMKAIGENVGRDSSGEITQRLGALTVTWCAGWVAFWTVLNTVLCLILGRWWQAQLFNPGGFRKEFHGLRLNASFALLCAGSMFYCKARGAEYYFWSLTFASPLILAGLGLMHAAIGKFRLGSPMVALAYLGVLLPPVQVILALLGLSDVWLDYRKKFKLMQ